MAKGFPVGASPLCPPRVLSAPEDPSPWGFLQIPSRRPSKGRAEP